MPKTAPRLTIPLGLFALVAAGIVLFWWWLGTPTRIDAAPAAAGRQFPCLSYAPFRPGQSPLGTGTHIDAKQIDEDLAQLAKVTGCVRLYATELGLDQLPDIARRHGIKVLQGVWLSRKPAKTAEAIAAVVALARKHPDVIQAVIVGNEVLLRREMPADELANLIRQVKAQVPVPVTYADVWEVWLRNRELADAVDFVTVHILPYWEDFPIAADAAAEHVASIYKKVATAVPGKDILIGEVGWPSAGRMREDALPSPVNQARVITQTLALAQREKFRLNIIEAYDQRWKRLHEGAVGGYWGLIDAWTRRFKFGSGEAISNHPFWLWQAVGGIVLAGFVFAAALAGRREDRAVPGPVWGAIAIVAGISGTLVGWTIENAWIESFDFATWLKSAIMAVIAVVAPVLGAIAVVAGRQPPSFAQILAPAKWRVRAPLPLVLGILLIVLTVMAIQVALGLVFNPRYQSFPFAPLTAALVPYFMLMMRYRGQIFGRAVAESVAAVLLAVSAVYIVFNESFANWQSLWFCAVLIVLALTLARMRDAPG